MRIYSPHDEEALSIRRQLKAWSGAGLLSDSQRQSMEKDAECDLRRTNGILRAVLFVFTLVSAIAITLLIGAFGPGHQGGLLLVLGVTSYVGAEVAVAGAGYYRHGIEEALALLSVTFICWGLQAVDSALGSLIPAVGMIASFLIYRRFGYLYAFFAGLIFAAFLPHYWTASPDGQRLILVLAYGAGLGIIRAIRRPHMADFLIEEYSIVESLLWLAAYLTLNLQLSSLSMLPNWIPETFNAPHFSLVFYWTTYGLLWIVPVAALKRALALRDKPLLLASGTMAIVTLITNKPYLGLARHEWDPMLLGILLTGVAVAVRRWLAKGPNGIRRGFTAQNLSGKDQHFMNALSAASGLMSPAATVTPQTHFGGGASGGGGASSDF